MQHALGAASPQTGSAAAAAAEHGRHDKAVLAAIGVGGALGSVARYGIALAMPVSAGRFPWATFAVNVTGALVLAVVMTLVFERWPPTRYVRPFVGIGVCGGFTTWSTFMTDTSLLARDGHVALAAGYVTATLLGGLGAAATGVALGRRWPGPAGEAVTERATWAGSARATTVGAAARGRNGSPSDDRGSPAVETTRGDGPVGVSAAGGVVAAGGSATSSRAVAKRSGGCGPADTAFDPSEESA